MNRSPLSPPLGLIVNPLARGVKRHHLRRIPFWRDLVPDAMVRITGDLADLDDAIISFREAGVRAVAGLGGDGSAHWLVDAMIRGYEGTHLPMVLMLAGGTMNGLPRALGAGGRPDHALRSVLGAIERDAAVTTARAVLCVTDIGDGAVRYGFSFANGVVYRVAKRYYRNPEPAALDMVCASLLPIKAALFGGRFDDDVTLDIQVDGQSWAAIPPHTVVASSLANPLFWFTPFGTGLDDVTAVHLCATSMRAREMAPRLGAIVRGRCRHPRLHISHAQEVVVRGDSGYLVDGDLYPCDGVAGARVTLGPILRFLVTP